ncbi:hypothetical protein PR048_009852 [Dryococelus australis]|uniref:Uncharacterized protein n=1 Tax=Dryococelus australis TaxID=614101 RepID=A0ABQ9I143_9NEOP|nr:hypothetical protein PR048_009852 [Dryococelus australis]
MGGTNENPLANGSIHHVFRMRKFRGDPAGNYIQLALVSCEYSSRYTTVAIRNSSYSDKLGIVGPENHRKHNNHRKTGEVTLQSIRSYMKSFPVIENHYLRAQTETLFTWKPIDFSNTWIRESATKCQGSGTQVTGISDSMLGEQD